MAVNITMNEYKKKKKNNIHRYYATRLSDTKADSAQFRS